MAQAKPNLSSPPPPNLAPCSDMLAVQSPDSRPLEDLHNERAYLLYSLQKQGERATRLFQRYAAVEARLAGATLAADIKRCKKEAARMRSKIAESTQQEQLTLLRLGEIHIELQNRHRWLLVHHQRPHARQPPLVYPLPPPPPPPSVSLSHTSETFHPNLCQDQDQDQDQDPEQERDKDTPITATSLATADWWSPDEMPCSSPPSALSPLSPCFTPGVAFAEDIWSRAASKTSSAGKESGMTTMTTSTTTTEDGSAGVTGSVEAVGEASGVELGQRRSCCGCGEGKERREEECDELGRAGDDGVAVPVSGERGAAGERPEGEVDAEDDAEDDVQAWRAGLRRMSLYLPMPRKTREAEKRMSMPYVKGLWSRSRRNSVHSTVG